MKLSRRQFLASSLVVAGGAFLGRPGLAVAEAKAAPPNPFELVPLGKTGLVVTRIGLGTGMHGGGRVSDHTRLGKGGFDALIKAAWERGVRLFDVADMYGTHPFLAGALKGLPRDQYAIVTKMWTGKGGLPEQERPDADILVDRFRKELQTDYIDVLQLHCQLSPTWCDQQKRQMDILETLKARKIIRAHGASIHSLAALEAAAASPWVDVVHVRINAYGEKMDAAPEKVAPVLERLHAAGKGVIGMKLVGEGTFSKEPEKIDKSIQYVLGLGTVDAAVVGFLKIPEIADFGDRVAKALQAKAAATA
ncbi:MAG: aldo/keto reductase [Planctomycetota bacterium]|nr:aldo/keto reductase [Planctomycetota bacterium]